MYQELDKAITGLFVRELRNTGDFFLGNVERHIKISIYI